MLLNVLSEHYLNFVAHDRHDVFLMPLRLRGDSVLHKYCLVQKMEHQLSFVFSCHLCLIIDGIYRGRLAVDRQFYW